MVEGEELNGESRSYAVSTFEKGTLRSFGFPELLKSFSLFLPFLCLSASPSPSPPSLEEYRYDVTVVRRSNAWRFPLLREGGKRRRVDRITQLWIDVPPARNNLLHLMVIVASPSLSLFLSWRAQFFARIPFFYHLIILITDYTRFECAPTLPIDRPLRCSTDFLARLRRGLDKIVAIRRNSTLVIPRKALYFYNV